MLAFVVFNLLHQILALGSWMHTLAVSGTEFSVTSQRRDKTDDPVRLRLGLERRYDNEDAWQIQRRSRQMVGGQSKESKGQKGRERLLIIERTWPFSEVRSESPPQITVKCRVENVRSRPGGE